MAVDGSASHLTSDMAANTAVKTVAKTKGFNQGSLRKEEKLIQLFQTVESRYMNKKELELYLTIVPDCSNRAAASLEISKVSGEVVKKTVDEVFLYYPFKEFAKFSQDKCVRDVGYVSNYATLAMLMKDDQWFDEKLLLWMRTIIQSFHYPAQNELSEKKSLFGSKPHEPTLEVKEIFEAAKDMPQVYSSIYATYVLLKVNFEKTLTQATWKLIEPYLQQAINSLSAK